VLEREKGGSGAKGSSIDRVRATSLYERGDRMGIDYTTEGTRECIRLLKVECGNDQKPGAGTFIQEEERRKEALK